MYKNLCLSFYLIFLIFPTHAQKSGSGIDSSQAGTVVYDSLIVERKEPLFPAYRNITNFSDLLDGLVPGVQVTNGDGQPGASGRVLIRGPHSIDGNGDPLFVVDGIPWFGSLNSININDIESVNVLKDGWAAARYGVLAANGAIEITTQKAPARRYRLIVDAKTGVTSQAYPGYDVIESEKEYYETYWQLLYNYYFDRGMSPASAGRNASEKLIPLSGFNAYNVPDHQVIDPASGKLNPEAQLKYHDDWKRAFEHVALRHDYNISVAQSGKNGNALFSVGYLNDEGYIRHTNFERFTARLNAGLNITQWLKAGLRVSGNISETQALALQVIPPVPVTQMVSPIYPIYTRDSLGNQIRDPLTGDYEYANLSPTNIVRDQVEFDNLINTKNLFVIPYIEIGLLRHFKLRTLLSYYIDEDQKTTGNKIAENYNNVIYKIHSWKELIAWDQDFGLHQIKLELAYERLALSMKQEGYILPNVGPGPGSVSTQRSTSTNSNRIESFMGYLNYNFRQKYFFSAGFRRDGSSYYPPQSKWVNNWIAEFAWAIEQEPFLENVKRINRLRLHVNYGASGIRGLFYRSANYDHTSEGDMHNLDIGMDYGFMNDYVYGKVNYFSRKRNYQLLTSRPGGFNGATLDGITGRVSGAELNLNFVLVPHASGANESFSWTVGFNLGHFKDKIIHMPAHTDSLTPGNKLITVGESGYQYYLPGSAGVDPRNGDELYYFKDVTGNRALTNEYTFALQNQYSGSGQGVPFPDWFGGISNTLEYKHIELSFHLTFGLGGMYYDQAYQYFMSSNINTSTWSEDILDSWTPEHTDTDVPRLNLDDPNVNQASSRFLTNASYLNIKNVNLAYNFSAKQAKKMKLNTLSIYLSGFNLWLFNARKGMNPQADFYGSSAFAYPTARTVMVGVHAGL